VCVCVCVGGVVVIDVDWWEEWWWCEVFGLPSYGSSKMFTMLKILQLEIWDLNRSYIVLMTLVELTISFKGLWKIDLFMASRFQVLYTWNNLKNSTVIQGHGKWVSGSFESSFNVPWKPSIVIGVQFWVYMCKETIFGRLGLHLSILFNVESLRYLKVQLGLSIIKCWGDKVEY
jgi:hypothetical protein